ncbi:MAG: hypothetical protein SPL41_02730 [Succinivibrionaceae bacterium]|nr:hypothetical protein [Succinivibrionaceae bacterium]MCI6199491.1 hypothetical protein [Pseudomonadota bacterium]MDD6545300.1 hypothetical protein [Pseudomonadota bacterium]MDY6273917.1 hypothetical protein [Succinivibrionaceae bacterium]
MQRKMRGAGCFERRKRLWPRSAFFFLNCRSGWQEMLLIYSQERFAWELLFHLLLFQGMPLGHYLRRAAFVKKRH